ncbi:MAG: single-stranded-DNA-specific exonuclease RecJ [Verrucomicrobiales bacterium]|nr:single-stranded-DNA-specific exonuclease RecJ [Verrucomicrobiales bacterium]
MLRRWELAAPAAEVTRELEEALRISPLLAKCLVNRDCAEAGQAERFMDPRLQYLADPFFLPNMRKAVERLFLARASNEPVTIFGDYDVDGITSTALLKISLEALGWSTRHYLPHRMDDGYGFSRDAVKKCLSECPNTIFLAVDCGSTNVESITWLREQQVDVLVLDHHQVADPPPPAFAMVNPQVSPDGDPCFRELCSAGLSFKLLHALVKHGRGLGEEEMHEFDVRPLLDLVALGTIADQVPLKRENRILVSSGLKRLNETQRPGIVALKEVALSRNEVGVYEVGFQLGPRLNAAGRLESATAALDLLLADDAVAAGRMAGELDEQNKERQKTQREISDHVIDGLRLRFDPDKDFVIVEGQSHWHIGVVGIVAGRVKDEFYRPSIIMGGDGDLLRGSGRSVAGFDLAAALRECDDLLLDHGGHAMASGLTILPEKQDAFRERINDIAREWLKNTELKPPLRLDAEATLYDLTMTRMRELEKLQPTGQENPPVHLVVRDLELQRQPYRMGENQQHAKIHVTDGALTAEAVIWNVPEGGMPEGRFDLAAAPSINEFRGRKSVQLKVLDWRPAGR